MEELHTNSSNNTLFADAEGNYAYFQANFVPKRNTRFDWGRPVDGSNAATEWQGIHTVDESPLVVNPSNGWVYNTNNWPYSAAGPNSPKQKDFPAYMETNGENARGLHAMRVLTDRKGWTLDSLLPHSHFRGHSTEYRASFPDGSEEVLLSGPAYDFNWQHIYVLEQRAPAPGPMERDLTQPEKRISLPHELIAKGIKTIYNIGTLLIPERVKRMTYPLLARLKRKFPFLKPNPYHFDPYQVQILHSVRKNRPLIVHVIPNFMSAVLPVLSLTSLNIWDIFMTRKSSQAILPNRRHMPGLMSMNSVLLQKSVRSSISSTNIAQVFFMSTIGDTLTSHGTRRSLRQQNV